VGVAGQLPGQLGAELLGVARDAFVHGMQVAATISATVAVAVAILAVVMLRNVGSGADREAAADAEVEAEEARAREPQRPDIRPTRAPLAEA
jgi:DHA2 family multidrug resistance protein-like MFS transporter